MSVVIHKPAAPRPASAAEGASTRSGAADDRQGTRIADDGKVRLGGMAPSLRPARITDDGRVRLGGMAPAI